eukprot:750733-Hanusia_phi.AAC.17
MEEVGSIARVSSSTLSVKFHNLPAVSRLVWSGTAELLRYSTGGETEKTSDVLMRRKSSMSTWNSSEKEPVTEIDKSENLYRSTSAEWLQEVGGTSLLPSSSAWLTCMLESDLNRRRITDAFDAGRQGMTPAKGLQGTAQGWRMTRRRAGRAGTILKELESCWTCASSWR